ncbi:MAG: xanthine dehydrogenase family protein subunit M [Acidobacteriota bacterium]
MNKFEYVNASSVKTAAAQLGADWSVRVKAGGIDLLDELKEHIIAPNQLVNIRSIPNLDYIKIESKGSLHIGALVTLAKVAANQDIRKRFLALAEAAGGAATPQIRNVATVGGNLCQRPRCWYYRNEEFGCLKKGGELCYAQNGENRFHAIFGNNKCAIVHPSATAVALVALGAQLKIFDGRSERTLDIEKFFITPEENVTRENVLKPNEIITEIIVPALPAGTRSFYLKQKEKQSFDWPLADVAVVLQMAGSTCKQARVVLGAAAPVPWRVSAVERALIGKRVDADLAKQAARLALEGARPLQHNAYKLPLFETLVARTILGAVQQA